MKAQIFIRFLRVETETEMLYLKFFLFKTVSFRLGLGHQFRTFARMKFSKKNRQGMLYFQSCLFKAYPSEVTLK